MSNVDITAPLWRYAGGSYYGGFNDPDMLEVGNGGCANEEYKSHLSLWAIMKSPLIVGMDLWALTPDSAAYRIISNNEGIAVNHDSLGLQARRVYSDGKSTKGKSKSKSKSDNSGELIATKCAWDVNTWMYQDAPADQTFMLRSDGRIESGSSGFVLLRRGATMPTISILLLKLLNL